MYLDKVLNIFCMKESFLKKYKPIFFSDFCIEKELTQLLKNLIAVDSLNILFIGPAACGKTSFLDAIIREYYGVEIIPTDNVLYINSLQEQGIQYYRNEVKAFCKIRTSIHGKKKFIVLDDIDSINPQSQQVFRNCIDKYKNNVQFICSCTNTQKVIESIQSRLDTIKINPIHKVIDNIQSRCTIIPLKPISNNFLNEIFLKIKKEENLNITKKAKKFILNVCNNSVRLLINYMEKFALLNFKITETKAKEICTIISFRAFGDYTNAWLIEKDLSKAIKIIFSIYQKGYSVMDILDNYFLFIKTTNILSETNKYELIKYICKYIAIFHTIHEAEIELAFFTNEIKKKIG